MKRLYLSVDGVLVRNHEQGLLLAPYAERFVDFALANFDCYWLTGHCHGDAAPVLVYLAPAIDDRLLNKLRAVKPTRYQELKTEALDGDFFWIESSPLAAEMTDLCRKGTFQRWVEVNTRVRGDDLVRAMDQLSDALCPIHDLGDRRASHEVVQYAMN
jgi:hypothetical protein